jgi:hypothetical protein
VRDFSSIVDAIFFFLCQQDPLGQVDPRAHVAFFRLFGLFLSHVPVPGRSRIFRTVSQEVSYTINLEFDEFSLFTGLSDLQISAARLELKNQSSSQRVSVLSCVPPADFFGGFTKLNRLYAHFASFSHL